MIEDNGPGVVTLGEGDRALAVAAVKAVLRVSDDEEDDLIAAFAESALGLAEQFLGAVTIARTLSERIPASAAWQRLGAAPVGAITGVTTPTGAALASDAFAIDIDAGGDGWVRVRDTAVRQVVVTYTAGIATAWADLPQPIRQGVALLAAYLFDARDADVAPPSAITALWRPFRRVALSGAAPC
jgi:uncharacterized phiE125 gp8 family phage protein